MFRRGPPGEDGRSTASNQREMSMGSSQGSAKEIPANMQQIAVVIRKVFLPNPKPSKKIRMGILYQTPIGIVKKIRDLIFQFLSHTRALP
jgi:hypothetical protein